MCLQYSVLIGLLLVVQLIAAVTAYYKEDEVKDVLSKGFQDTLSKYGENTTEAEEIRNTWNFIQKDVS